MSFFFLTKMMTDNILSLSDVVKISCLEKKTRKKKFSFGIHEAFGTLFWTYLVFVQHT